jgi:hypothetical protein
MSAATTPLCGPEATSVYDTYIWAQQPPRQLSLRQYLYFSTSKQVSAAASASYDTYMSAAATSRTALIYVAYLANSLRGHRAGIPFRFRPDTAGGTSTVAPIYT